MICYRATKQDERVAALIPGWDKHTIANLRGMYDTKNNEETDWEGMPDEAVKERVLRFNNELKQQAYTDVHRYMGTNKRDKFSKLKDGIIGAIKKLKETYLYNEVRDTRVNMISNMFTTVVDTILKNERRLHPTENISREDIIKGVKINGVYKYGEAEIFNRVYKVILEQYARNIDFNEKQLNDPALSQEDKDDIEDLLNELEEKYRQIFMNWGALITLARVKLKQTEGIKLGNTQSFADYANEGNFDEDGTFDDFDASETVRDGFQKFTDSISSFGSISKDVRLALSRCVMPKLERDEEGNVIGADAEDIEVDDLGFPQYIDPVEAHNFLTQLFRGAKNSEHMMDIFRNYIDKHPASKYSTVLNMLEGSPEMRTKFYTDLVKNFQTYSIIQKVRSAFGQISYKTIILNNKHTGSPMKKYLTSIMRPEKSASESEDRPSSTIYDTKGNIRPKRVEEVVNQINKVLGPLNRKDKADTEDDYKWKDWRKDARSKNKNVAAEAQANMRKFLTETLTSLGIDPYIGTNNVVDNLLSKEGQKSLIAVINALRKLATKGLDKNGRSSTLADLWRNADEGSYYKALIGYYASSKGKNAVMYSNIQRILKELDKMAATAYEPRASYKDAKGKTISLYSNVAPSYLGDFIEKIKQTAHSENPRDEIRNWIENNFIEASYFVEMETEPVHNPDGSTSEVFTGKPKRNKNGSPVFRNAWLQELWDSFDEQGQLKEGSLADLIEYTRFMGGQINDNGDPMNFENFTSRQHAVTLIEEFFADEQQNRGKDSAWYPTFILGDSGVQKFIHAKRYTMDEIWDKFYDVLGQEIDRCERARELLLDVESNGKKIGDLSNLKDTIAFNGEGKDQFVWLRFLNDEGFQEYVKNKYKVDIMKGNKFNIDLLVDKNQMMPIIKDGLLGNGGELKGEVGKFIDRLIDMDVLRAKEDKDKKYSLEDLGFLDMKGQNINKYNSKEDMIDGARAAITDYFLNTKFATIEQLQLMTIDTGFYVNTKDLQKRYKEIHAPGTILDLMARDIWAERANGDKKPVYASEDGIERCEYFDDIQLPSNEDFIKLVKNQFGLDDLKGTFYKNYLKNTLTDGQGYRTLRSYRKVMIMAGKWNDNLEAVYKEIQQIRQQKDGITSENIQRLAELAQVLQPIKPYMFTQETYKIGNNTVKIPVQHKYSESVLIPELLPKGSVLRDMAELMDERNIDLIGSTKIVKVGAFGQFSFDGVSDKAALAKAMDSGVIHELDYKDYRIQTNVPEHLYGSRLFGTQTRKMIMAHLNLEDGDYSSYFPDMPDSGIKLDKNNTLPKGKMNGKQLLRLYNGLISANMLESFQEFVKEIGNLDTASQRLIQGVISNNREAFDNLLAYAVIDDFEGFRGFAMPLFEGGLEHDSAALLFSIFKNVVNKQKINGGSAVQASALGIEGYEKDGGLHLVMNKNKDNLLYAECEIPFDFKWTDSKGVERELDYNDYVDPKTGKPLLSSIEIPEWGEVNVNGHTYKYEDYQSFKDADGKVKIPKIELDFPEILNLVAYRIPTERDYSILNIKAVKFSHKTAGAVIKVPLEGTSIAGFDFDIDKLFFIRKEFKKRKNKQRELSPTEEYNAWTAYFKKHEDIRTALEYARKQAGYTAEEEKKGHPLNSFWYSTTATMNIVKRDAFSEGMKLVGIKAEQEESEVGFEEYDYSKTPLENSRTARNNMLLHLIQQRLQDKETLNERITPGGFANASKAAREMRELINGQNNSKFVSGNNLDIAALSKAIVDENRTDPEPDYDPTDPFTIIHYNQQNQIAGKLIGIFANQNTNAALASVMQVMHLRRPILFGSLIGARIVSHFGSSKADQEVGSNLLAGVVEASDGTRIDTALTVAEFLAASVDAVKDPVLNYLNLNTLTANAGALLARLGYSTRDIGLLFNQPIVKEACEYAFNNNIQLDQAFDEIFDHHCDIKERDRVNSDREQKSPSSYSELSADRLAYTVANGVNREDATYRLQQAQVTAVVREALQAASELNQFVQATKFTASNAVGSTPGDMYNQQMKTAKYLHRVNSEGSLIVIKVSDKSNKPLNEDIDIDLTKPDNYEDYLAEIGDNPFAYEQTMYDLNKQMLKVINQYYPYDTQAFTECRKTLQGFSKNGILSADTINQMHSDLLVFMLNMVHDGRFDGTGQAYNLDDEPLYAKTTKEGTLELCKKEDEEAEPLGNRDYYLKVFPKELLDWLSKSPDGSQRGAFSWLREYPLFRDLQPELIGNEDKDGIIENPQIGLQLDGAMNMNTAQKEDCMDIWTSLMDGSMADANDLDEKDSQFLKNVGTALFMYNFYKLGFGYHPTTFMHLCPNEVKERILVEDRVPMSEPNGGERRRGRSYREYLNKILRGDVPVEGDIFAVMYAQNHPDDYSIIFTPNGKLRQYISKSAGTKNEFYLSLEEINKSYAKEANSWRNLLTLQKEGLEKGVVAFRPFIKLVSGGKTYLYAAIQDGKIVNEVSEDMPIRYVKVAILGEKGKSLNYTGEKGAESIVDNTIESSTGHNPEDESNDKGTSKPYDRSKVIDAILDITMGKRKLRGMSEEEIQKLKEDDIFTLAVMNDKELKEFADNIDTNKIIDDTGKLVC